MNRNIIADKLITKYRNNLINDQDKKLIDLIFSPSPTQKDVDDFLQNYDIEAAGTVKALMLSYFKREHPELKFSAYEEPRLKGLFNFYRFANLNLMKYFAKIGKEFNKNHIPMLIMKGFAMKYLRPDLARAMGDIDVLVPEKDYIKSIKLLRNMDYRLTVWVHSADVHEPESDGGIMDIHRFFYMYSMKERKLNKYLFKRARKEVYNGIEILVPCYEDILFILLANLTVNLRNNTSKASVLFALFDAKYLISQEGFDWNIVIENAKKTDTLVQIAFAIYFINTLVPNLVPNKIASDKLFDKAVKDYSALITFDKSFFPAFQKIVRNMKFVNALSNFDNFVRYLNLKVQYKIYKAMRQNKFVVNNILNLYAKRKVV